MKQIISVLIIFTGFFCHAGELPKWVENSCKVVNLNQFVKWMKDSDIFYNIRETTSKEIKIESGQVSQDVRMHFDDSKKCLNRIMRSTCTPIGLDTDHPALVVILELSDCENKRVMIRKTVAK